MPVFNLLESVGEITRDVSSRLINKEENRVEAMKFGEAYFDGPREQGYGGYYYDGRWTKIADKAISRYDLKIGDRVLDIGCAKGFFVNDLVYGKTQVDAYGVDVSEYAVKNCHPDVIGRLHIGNALKLPFPDNSFDAVFAINTLHNLDREECVRAIREINRVVKRPEAAFVQVDAYRNDEELALFEAWMLTAKTYCRPEEWEKLFSEANFKGDYFWTILQFGTTV
ncbi:class I SAM-dependent methyltransferase [Thalassospira lucentensis]|uniref:class I SAM-dependent methyltransferase n=1 Tax=Thalassospira lucentensis TaxID=168935 RepID=UPI002942E409|nr:methyltransferase domain-containing protein [Thalassospira lucentensis]WOI11822.1 methyltransferase domain-containing protein [Thalassospira lucentensis]